MSEQSSVEAGVVRFRSSFAVDRRTMLRGMAAGAVLAGGLGPRRAMAASPLNYLGWEGYDAFLSAGDFEKAHSASLQKTFISSADEIVTKLRLGAAHVDLCTPYFIHDKFLAEENLIEALDLSKIPNFDKLNPTIKKFCEANMSADGKWYAAPMTFGSICMLYNADVMKTPTSWTDMLRPEFKGKCAITADYVGNIFAWARVAGVANPHAMTKTELSKVVAQLIDLKKNHLRTIAPSYGDLVNMLSSKEVVICQGWEPVTTWVGTAANIKIAYPQEKCMGFIEGYAIGKGSENVDAAHAFINNALSVEGQLAGASANSMPVVTTEAMEKADAANRSLYDYANLENYFTERTITPGMYPLEPSGDLAVWDDYQEAWEKVIKG